jgi:aspartate aminotransferase
MTAAPVARVASRRSSELQALTAPVVSFLTGSVWARRQGEPNLMDFVVGNPHEMPLGGVVDALRQQLEPRSNDWFAYQMSDPTATASVAEGLRTRLGMDFEAADVLMTSGAFAGLSVALKALIDPGDEVIFISPPWFFYESLIAAEWGTAVRLALPPPAFQVDADALAAAITPRTRAVIVNSPHNPTGRVYSQAELASLAAVLDAASQKYGRRVYLLSDEAYSRIVFDDQRFTSPTSFYPWSVLIYTYGKTLLTPGQRLGFMALPPSMPLDERVALRGALTLSQVMTGYAFPNALMQRAVPALESLSVDVAVLQRKRDVMVAGLRAAGYDVAAPQATFYVLPRSPVANDLDFVSRLAERDVFVLPGSLVELPGYFRISLTATEEMIERALPVFAALAALESRS